MKSSIRILTIFALVLLIGSMYQCANMVPPVGGPRDETPPELDSSETSPNYQTNYAGDPIILTFNEWIALKDASAQIVVSPPLRYPLDVKLKKKSVYVEFNDEEELKENTTYTINFGEAIVDYTEGNVPPNMRYVFSTGDVIDSLQFKAKLIDIDTKKPVEDALLMLYVNRADSVIYTTKPFYFAKTDTSGVAIIENIRADTFKVVALKDGNLNYQLDGETELFTYLIDPVVVQGNADIGSLEMYTNQQPLIRKRISNRYGKSTIVFNREPYDLSYELIGDPPDIDYMRVEADSLMLWYRDTTREGWSIVIDTDTSRIDTVAIRKVALPKGPLTGRFEPSTQRKSISFKTDTTLTYRWGRPIASIDPDRMSLAKDSAANVIPVEYVIDPNNQHLLKAQGVDWAIGANYFWTIADGAVTDIFDTPNDSLGLITVNRIDDKTLGSVLINFEGLVEGQDYIVQLTTSGQVRKEGFVSVEKGSIEFKYLDPATYTIRLIEDDNSNGRWDTGDYDRQGLPERIYIKVMAPLKANWEQTIDFKL